MFSAFTPPFLKCEIHSPWRPSLRALWFRGSESNSMCFITCLSNPGKGKHMSQWNTIEFRLCVDFSPILTRHIQRNKSPFPDSADLICSSSSTSSSESSQCRRLCLPLSLFFFFFQLPIRLVASLVAVYSPHRQKEKRAISSPDLPLLSKYKRGADLLDTYISW